MPIADAEGAVDLQLFVVDEEVTGFRSKYALGYLHLDGGGARKRALRQRSVVGELHPHEIDGNEEAVFAGFGCCHQADIEIGEKVDEAGMKAGVPAKKAGC